MQLRFKYLTICTLSIMLMACGGSGDSIDIVHEVDNSCENYKFKLPVANNYVEPSSDVVDASVLGFNDCESNGQLRLIRNDLSGNFNAMIQFAQSHVVDPKGNEAKKMPRLTMEKETLLLVTPTLDMGNISDLTAEIYMGNQLIRSIKLEDPSQIPATDQTNTDRAPVIFSKRAWSGHLNWDEVRPSLNIQIKDSVGRLGQIGEADIDFASPGELVLNNIRVGMLSEPPISTSHYMLLEPEKAGTDYFQTIPAAKMTVAKYDDMTLDKVMIASGIIYDSVSASKGDVYSGDMRENVGKSTFSVGINLANWGITSASMASQTQPQLTQSVIVHHTRGQYANGFSNHGLSGGNGMLTLYSSIGNEFSHEIGHHYGLGHYPGQLGSDQYWTSHHYNSGWGYIPYRNMMRGNLIWGSKTLWASSTNIANFMNLYPFTRDAMAGGAPASSVSNYTHYTGYSTYLKIQPHFDRYVWDKTSPTGYKKWNKDTRQMEVAQPVMPNSTSPVWYQPNQNYLKPRVFGEPVFTILGGYDPVNQVGLLYPAARSNWGNVFDLPAANIGLENASCWLDVKYATRTQNIALAPTRLSGNANKLHVNLAIADQPEKVDLYCKKANEPQRLLSSITIPQYQTPIKPAVKIGKEDGYNALRALELPTLQQELISQAGKSFIALSSSSTMLYNAYKQYKHELSPAALQQLERYEEHQNKFRRLNRWVSAYQNDLTKGVATAKTAMNQFIAVLGLDANGMNNGAALFKNNSNCLKVEKINTNDLDVYISGSTGCTGDETEQWIYDSQNRIHSKFAIDQCLTGNGNNAKVTLSECSGTNANQVWTMNSTTSAVGQFNQCMDLNTGRLVNNRQILIRYSCSGNSNQRWSMLTPNLNLILSGVSGKNLALIVKN